MAQNNQIPERLINFNVYSGNDVLLGVAEVELPALEAMTDTISGAGIAGEYESPVLGHFGSMTATFSFRTLTDAGKTLLAQKSHEITIRGAQQVQNRATGAFDVQSVRVAMRATPKNLELGTFAVASTTDTSMEMEVTYIKIDVSGVTIVELDKLNTKFEVNGVDFLRGVRDALGI